MPKIIINDKEIEFEKGMTVLQACEIAEVEINQENLLDKPMEETPMEEASMEEAPMEEESLLSRGQ